jgi:glucose/arabinose dehydrogenase
MKTSLRTRKLAFESLESRRQLAGNLSIYAAGATGEETMQLLIDNRVVNTWDNVGGNAATRQFNVYNFAWNDHLTPDRVRVAFTNDFYAPPMDRNLLVDRIEIDGIAIQTESSTVFSTGTWLSADGIKPGFRQNEYLHTNGYFQYAVNTGSVIQVIAAGSTGLEGMDLQIDGQTAFTWRDIGGDGDARQLNEFMYRAPGSIAANRIRIAMPLDVYQPPIDYNLLVDKLIIDGVEFQTEAPSVLSTGTYQANLGGAVAGFWQTEWLHVEGYFQYDARVAQPGNLGLESSVYATREGTSNVTVSVVRTGGVDGRVGVNYKMVNNTAVSGSDFTTSSGTLFFDAGETRKTISIPILNDSTREPPETFNVVIEDPQGGATLLAPRTATITITDDDLTLPNYTSFPNNNGLKLNGAASVTSSTLQLTPNSINQRGTAFYSAAIPLNAATSFQTNFQLKAVGGTTGGDGFTWIVQNSAAGNAALGNGGSGLAYEGVASSFAIEFDTVKNIGELNSNHISIWRNGSLQSSLLTKAINIDFNSGPPVNAWIDYNGDSDQLALYISSTTTKPTSPVGSVALDLFSLVGNRAYFGFGAATSTVRNAQQVLNWKLSLDRPVTPPPPPPGNLTSEDVVTGLIQPTSIDFSNDGRNMYIAQKDGNVIVVRDGVRQTTPFIDISGQVNNNSDRGLLDIAVHPNFPITPFVYLLFTYDPPQVYNNLTDALAGPDKPGNRAGRLVRVTADAATNYTRAVTGSEVILLGSNSLWANFNAFINSTENITAPQGGLNPDGSYIRDFIASDSQSHTVGSLAFSSDGSLYVSIGDGASYNTVDPRATRVQDLDSLSGKLLRINPINGQGFANNPYYNGDLDSNRSKVYQYGLRNPFRVSTNPITGQPYIGDVGWGQWEEINAGPAGANFGWPYFEGANGASQKTYSYQDLPKAIEFYASGQSTTPSIYALNHAADGINAIVMGAYYTGSTYPSQYQNNIFFNDLGQGIVRAATLDSNGVVASMENFATGAQYVVQIVQGTDGNLYFVDLDDGKVGRWRFVATASVSASRTIASVSANPIVSSPTTTTSNSAATSNSSLTKAATTATKLTSTDKTVPSSSAAKSTIAWPIAARTVPFKPSIRLTPISKLKAAALIYLQ